MKKWLQNLSGAVMASLLAVTLSGRAFAETEEPQALPAEAPTQVVESAVPVPVEAMPVAAPVSAAEEAAPVTAPTPAAVPVVAEAAPAVVQAPTGDAASAAAAPAAVETPAAVEPSVAEVQAAEIPAAEVPAAVPEASVTVSDASGAEIPGAEASVASGIPAGELSVAEPVTPAAEVSAAAEDDEMDITETPAAAVDVQQPVTETAQEGESQPAEEAELLNTTLAVPETRSLQKNSSPAVRELPSVSKEEAAVDTLSVSGTETEEQEEDPSEEPEGEDIKAPTRGTGEGGEENSGQAATTVFSHNEDGSYTLVNHTGTENLSADGDITVLAAGLNRIGSISGSRTVRVAGTGILLIDSLEGNLELLTFTDVYDEGSVAVFVKQEDSTYLLKNGTVPGILDEEYRVEGVTLVMPESTSLHLIGTGAKPKHDGDGNITGVTYYHGTEHGCKTDTDDEFKDAVEITGNLTIAQEAALIIRKALQS